ncbi:GGDEF domain-containing protein [Aureimonas jatrophae]|uniref:Diguanylate cyclase (GGDEF) domain-containing protein n=1 Tax=Aureimonas jatrophae TaxID=1166073 RepID=A0A1H0LS31_9HYPH|nr:diguanylate cyclase [Aureimonas jatrophae]MBB3952724.1 diguanylate cyclase (GGDEF)-like protein [Aureimonas jatrophae]SDO71069.1 diguanylate cyclase (GGDEF) domain-containing protein [Aureimonas jatrophae]
MTRTNIPAYRALPDEVVADLTARMYESRTGVRWMVLIAIAPTVAAVHQSPSISMVLGAIAVWLACAVRIAVAEGYARFGERSQSRRTQIRWQAAYGVGGIGLSLAFAAFTSLVILGGDASMLNWALATAVGMAYGPIPYVALQPKIGYLQTTIPLAMPAAFLAMLDDTTSTYLAVSMLAGIISVLGHCRLQYARAVEALLDRRSVERLATTDPLTGLWNRRQLEAVVRQALNEKLGGLHWLGIDLDRFKSVNDTLGHEAGDLVLCAVARRIAAIVGEDAFVSRVGGDEFVVLLTGDRDRARRLADRISDAIRQPIPVPQGTARIGASVGTTAICSHDTIDEIARRADERMYARKAGTRRAA